MFCHDFEKIAGALAAGHLMEAGKRERALHHASECSACALRLKAERTLEVGLRALCEGADDREAPPQLKTKLRAAFDQQVKADPVAPVAPVAPVVTVVTVAPVLAFAPARSRKSARLWMAAAALILISIGVASLSGLPGAAPPNSTVDMSNGGKQAQREQSPPPIIKPGEPVNQQKIDTDVARKASPERRARRRAAIPEDMAANNESVSDYIPLTYLADATDVESGTVLRVELPPSALITMGLPMNVDRTDSRVKADLIVGDDGVPRAVRFVGEDSSKEIRR
jgi:hypothetical protein